MKPSAEIIPELEQLLINLDSAFDAFNGVDRDVHLIDQQQYVQALLRVAEFLYFMDRERYAIKFMGLANALRDLKQGTVSPLFRPQKMGKGSRPGPSQVWIQKASIALAVCGLIAKHLKREDAAAEIIKRCPDVANLVSNSRTKYAATAILSWHDQFSDGRKVDRIAAGVYENGKAELAKAIATNRIDEQVTSFLDAARKQGLGPR